MTISFYDFILKTDGSEEETYFVNRRQKKYPKVLELQAQLQETEFFHRYLYLQRQQTPNPLAHDPDAVPPKEEQSLLE